MRVRALNRATWWAGTPVRNGAVSSHRVPPLAISAPADTTFSSLPRSPDRPGRQGPARGVFTFQQVRVHVAQHVGDPQLLAGTGATVDVQPSRLREGSAQRGDGECAGQG